MQRVIWAAVATVALLSIDSLAQDSGGSATQKPCVSEDIIGHVYKMVEFKETPPRSETVWLQHFSYSYLAFGQNSSFFSISTNREIKDLKKLEQAIAPRPGSNKMYTLDKSGVLNLLINGKPHYSYRCIEILKPTGAYVKDDLVLTGYTRKAKSELFKLYRRWY